MRKKSLFLLRSTCKNLLYDASNYLFHCKQKEHRGEMKSSAPDFNTHHPEAELTNHRTAVTCFHPEDGRRGNDSEEPSAREQPESLPPPGVLDPPALRCNAAPHRRRGAPMCRRIKPNTTVVSSATPCAEPDRLCWTNQRIFFMQHGG